MNRTSRWPAVMVLRARELRALGHGEVRISKVLWREYGEGPSANVVRDWIYSRTRSEVA